MLRQVLVVGLMAIGACARAPSPSPSPVGVGVGAGVGVGDEKDREIARLKAQLAERDGQLHAAPGGEGSKTAAALLGVEVRSGSLRKVCSYFESGVGPLSIDLRLSIADTLDENGRVKDPVAFCRAFREGFVKKYGGRAQAALVTALGAEVGTQLFHGSLCEGPAVERGLAPPSPDEMTQAFATQIEKNPSGWARTIHVRLDDLIDETGHLNDVLDTAKKVRTHIARQGKSTALRTTLDTFGSEVGSALYYDRIGEAR
jgi:hypothetical protein